jgi:murein DD-endopeptidase MepM/ murein hydrolase activator NlpD
MSTRTPGGRKVKAGDKIGEVGNSSSFKIGFHLHFERHKKHADNWGCGIIVTLSPLCEPARALRLRAALAFCCRSCASAQRTQTQSGGCKGH